MLRRLNGRKGYTDIPEASISRKFVLISIHIKVWYVALLKAEFDRIDSHVERYLTNPQICNNLKSRGIAEAKPDCLPAEREYSIGH